MKTNDSELVDSNVKIKQQEIKRLFATVIKYFVRRYQISQGWGASEHTYFHQLLCLIVLFPVVGLFVRLQTHNRMYFVFHIILF